MNSGDVDVDRSRGSDTIGIGINIRIGSSDKQDGTAAHLRLTKIMISLEELEDSKVFSSAASEFKNGKPV